MKIDKEIFEVSDHHRIVLLNNNLYINEIKITDEEAVRFIDLIQKALETKRIKHNERN